MTGTTRSLLSIHVKRMRPSKYHTRIQCKAMTEKIKPTPPHPRAPWKEGLCDEWFQFVAAMDKRNKKQKAGKAE